MKVLDNICMSFEKEIFESTSVSLDYDQSTQSSSPPSEKDPTDADNFEESTCSPPCRNSTCKWSTCQCEEGFRSVETADYIYCLPVCNGMIEGCLNGYCSQPEVCTCNDGFSLGEGNPYECLPDVNKIKQNEMIIWQSSFKLFGILAVTALIIALIIVAVICFHTRRMSYNVDYAGKYRE